MTRNELLRALADQLSTDGDVVVAPTVDVRLWRPRLTQREVDVLTCLATGLTYREIGGHLAITAPTVKTHTCNIVGSLQCGNARAAIAMGLLSGRVRQEDVIDLWRRYRPHFLGEDACQT